MNWLDKLERRYPQLALEGLMRYISFLMLTVFFLNRGNLLTYDALNLNAQAIQAGQVWRLLTFMLIPSSGNFLFLIFELSILVMCADGLEAEWGTFKLTVYYLFGVAANIMAAFVMSFLFPFPIAMGSYFIYLTLFLGFATLYPDYEILLFFILPVKIKYLALLSGAWLMYGVAVDPFPIKIFILLSVANYLLFFGPDFVKTMKGNYHAHSRRKDYESKAKQPDGPRHKCQICGKTEASDPELQFRYCTCNECGPDGIAFCDYHLKEHKEANQS